MFQPFVRSKFSALMLKSPDLMNVPCLQLEPIYWKYPRVKNAIWLPRELIWIKARAGCAVNGCRGNGGGMAEIMIKCPATSHAISTEQQCDLPMRF